ncbi:hypothetical protein JTE90_023809 [Oedothorax gibbosus]|uniref:Uncharacterized protein n=1 Tax=Oedothorax gibbosus TaxID=931172 RepID=A0AAV6VJM5_9ARAC|nr:hypothetical protein JTE90_023809 [Oedothorax gibbosus]
MRQERFIIMFRAARNVCTAREPQEKRYNYKNIPRTGRGWGREQVPYWRRTPMATRERRKGASLRGAPNGDVVASSNRLCLFKTTD